MSDLFRVDDDGLVLPRSAHQTTTLNQVVTYGMLVYIGGGIVLGSLASGVLAMVPVFGWLLGAFLTLAWLLLAVLGALATHRVLSRDHPVEVDADGARTLTWPATVVQRPEKVVVSGEPGQPVVVVLDGADADLNLLSEGPCLDGDGWTWARIDALVGHVAQILEVPVSDSRDHPEWQRWLEDDGYRVEIEFRHRLDENVEAQPALHEAAPVEPPSLTIDHAGLSAGRVRVSTHALSVDELDVPLSEIRNVQPLFRRRTQRREQGPKKIWMEATLLVRTEDAVHQAPWRVLPKPYVDKAGELHWLAARVREEAAKARPGDFGSEADVPQALNAIRADVESTREGP